MKKSVLCLFFLATVSISNAVKSQTTETEATLKNDAKTAIQTLLEGNLNSRNRFETKVSKEYETASDALYKKVFGKARPQGTKVPLFVAFFDSFRQLHYVFDFPSDTPPDRHVNEGFWDGNQWVALLHPDSTPPNFYLGKLDTQDATAAEFLPVHLAIFAGVVGTTQAPKLSADLLSDEFWKQAKIENLDDKSVFQWHSVEAKRSDGILMKTDVIIAFGRQQGQLTLDSIKSYNLLFENGKWSEPTPAYFFDNFQFEAGRLVGFSMKDRDLGEFLETGTVRIIEHVKTAEAYVVKFERASKPFKNRVTVNEHPDIRYELHDGKILKLVDSDLEESKIPSQLPTR